MTGQNWAVLCRLARLSYGRRSLRFDLRVLDIRGDLGPPVVVTYRSAPRLKWTLRVAEPVRLTIRDVLASIVVTGLQPNDGLAC